ncbi:MAG TPA: TIGR03067 domain-containing protein [Gemmataceae bacterium]|nr:TIGR03067 domain-containing protein [Gemmataceae bacterium]
MKPLGLTLVCLMLWGSAPQEDMKKELAKFEGTWQPFYVEADGKVVKADIKDHRLVVAGKAFVFTGDGGKQEGTIAIDPGKKPPTIDTEFTSGDHKGTKMVGIYEFSKDRLMVCYTAAPGERPTEFKTREKSGLFIVMYKRIK